MTSIKAGLSAYTEQARGRARLALPILVRQAESNEPITYGDLALEMGVHHRAIRHVLGYVRDEVCEPRGLPLLNVLVVNRETGVPGESFLPEGASERMSVEERRGRFQQELARLCSEDWGPLLQEFGLRHLHPKPRDLEDEARRYERRIRRSGVGEGPVHRRLKLWVAANPKALGLSRVTKHTIEYMHPSGDEADVLFERRSAPPAVVEVKVGERGELVKGIYQLVKYRALLSAERGQGKRFDVDAHLVAHAIPADIEALARRLQISIHAISPERVR